MHLVTVSQTKNSIALLRRLACWGWGTEATTLQTAIIALVHSIADYCAPVWCRSAHTHLIDAAINDALQIITGCPHPTPADNLPSLTNSLSGNAWHLKSRHPSVPPHNSSSDRMTTISEGQCSGWITIGRRSCWTTLRYSVFSSQVSTCNSGVASPELFWESKIFDFRQATVLLFGTLLLKAQNDHIC